MGPLLACGAPLLRPEDADEEVESDWEVEPSVEEEALLEEW